MNVLVVSEGKHEYGTAEYDGALVELTRRTIRSDARFTREKVSSQKVHIHRKAGKHKEYEKRALGWIRYARNQGFDALVFLVDQDGQQERETGVKKAQNHDGFSLPRAMGVAIRTFDAWMLADEQALTKALGDTIQRQQAAESIKDPKGVCERLRDNSSQNMGLTKLYSQIAQTLDLDLLNERCPRGFAPFRKRVQQLGSHPESTH